MSVFSLTYQPMDTPLLLLAWRRPHTVQKVIDAVRPMKPTNVFVACDGPNANIPDQVDLVRATREVIENQIDWPCKINRLYSNIIRVAALNCRAISWFLKMLKKVLF